MKRSALSIPCNVAEGSQRIGIKDYIRFLGIARGSAAELETQIIVAFELSYIEEGLYKYLALKIEEIRKILNYMISKLRTL